MSELVGIMKAQHTSLQVICLEDGSAAGPAAAQRASNQELLDGMIKEVGGKEIRCGCMKARVA